MHNRLRDSFYLILSHLAPYAKYTTTTADVALEPTGLIPSFPTLRPADVALRLIPGSIHAPLSHLLLDVTIIPMPSFKPTLTNDSYLLPVIRHHEYFENRKFVGRHRLKSTRDTVLQELLSQNYGLLPITMDPGGQLGPLSSKFLWKSSHAPTTVINSPERSLRGLSFEAATNLANRSASAFNAFALFQRANAGWKHSHHDQWFTRSYTAITPSQWGIQVLSQNILLAIASHIQIATARFTSRTASRPPKLLTASIAPRLARPTFALPSIYRFTSIHSVS
jgi:hypothetical protein